MNKIHWCHFYSCNTEELFLAAVHAKQVVVSRKHRMIEMPLLCSTGTSDWQKLTKID